MKPIRLVPEPFLTEAQLRALDQSRPNWSPSTEPVRVLMLGPERLESRVLGGFLPLREGWSPGRLVSVTRFDPPIPCDSETTIELPPIVLASDPDAAP